MTKPKFDEALEAVFEERADEFSPESRHLLKRLWDQGQQAGRELERHDTRQHGLSLEKAVRSECGNYLCFPVPKEMLVLEGAAAGMDRLEHEIRTHQRDPDSRTSSPMPQMLASMDAEILEKLASQAKTLEAYQQGIVLVVPTQAPRVPARQPENTLPWTVVDQAMTPTSVEWQRKMFGAFNAMEPILRQFGRSASSLNSSMLDALNRPITLTDAKSDKR